MKYYRSEIVKQAQSWIGCNEKDGSHKEIIDIYNSHKPLARGYKIGYNSAWCSCFASAVAIKCGYTEIIPTEVSCYYHIELFKKMGCWVENDGYTPKAGDYIFYDWEDSGNGDNQGSPNHVGIVEKVSGTTITVIDGNNSNDAVGRRTAKVNGKYIRGYGVPKYDGYAPEEVTPIEPTKNKFNIGDKVIINGKLYKSSNSNTSSGSIKNKVTNITRYDSGSKHPYNTTGDLGWMDESSIEPYSKKTTQTIHTVQKGEYLIKIAKKYGVKWTDIAKKNNIKFPYIIKAGQKLIIK